MQQRPKPWWSGGKSADLAAPDAPLGRVAAPPCVTVVPLPELLNVSVQEVHPVRKTLASAERPGSGPQPLREYKGREGLVGGGGGERCLHWGPPCQRGYAASEEALYLATRSAIRGQGNLGAMGKGGTE